MKNQGSDFKLIETPEITYLTVPLLESAGAGAWFSTRRGGVSPPPYDSLNLGFHVGDRAAAVQENRTRLFTALGLDPDSPVAGEQVHRDELFIVDQRHKGRGVCSDQDALPGVDGLLTRSRGLPLSSYYADCVPIYLLDPRRPAAGLVHAGWRGTVLRIGARAIKAMTDTFGVRPGECLGAIGPSIGPCCYEVDEQVMSGLRQGFSNWRQLAEPAGPGRWKLDLAGANRQALIEAGLRPENIALAGYCTACRRDLFFSYRFTGGKTGRMASVLVLR
ncbi:MAG: peptidoglycan editing factor PgeF [Bacillota bacterium]